MGKFFKFLLLLIASSGTSSLEQIDNLGRYFAGWTYHEQEGKVEFEVIAETTGFVGFGLSPKGGMVGADITIGGIKDDVAYFKDYHATENFPIEDESQDWVLLDASENATHTYLRFERILETCDKDDYTINSDTLKIIWSMGQTDAIGYHQNNRGAYSVNMLDPLPEVDESEFERFRISHKMDMLAQDTIYWCTVHRRPQSITGKHHIVGFKPYLPTEYSKKHAHHFSIFTCRTPEGVENPEDYFEDFLGNGGGECYGGDASKVPLDHCYKYLFDWSVGGREVLFPEHVGLPIGEQEVEYFMYEIHWDNPKSESGFEIETGVDVLYSSDIREFDAELLVIVHKVEPSLLLPYDYADHVTSGHCSGACTAKHLPSEGVKAFNLNLHAHIHAKKIRVRHFRPENEEMVELPWFGNDDNYDFNYQENRPLRDEITILPGDQLSIECSYDTTGKNPKGVVIGGYSTREEMCESYIYYYPRQSLAECLSFYPPEKLYERFGIEEVISELGQIDPTIIKPEKWANKTFSQVLNEEFEWTEELKKEISLALRFEDHYDSCDYYAGGGPDWTLINYPNIDKVYEPEDICLEDSTGYTDTDSTDSKTEYTTTDENTDSPNSGDLLKTTNSILLILINIMALLKYV